MLARLLRRCSAHRVLRVIDQQQDLNREMKYDQVIGLYEHSQSPEARTQYIHALTLKSLTDLHTSQDYTDRPGSSPHSPLYVSKTAGSAGDSEGRSELWGGLLALAAGATGLYYGLDSNSGLGVMHEARKHLVTAEKVITTFQDMKGVDECLEEVKDIVDFLQNPARYHMIGARLPKGVLLTGSPGTGKTMLARAIAGEAGVKFFYNSGSDFEEVYVGVGAKRVRELFEAAKKHSPAIVFIDEIDALGTSRTSDAMVYHRQSLNQLLVEMDGFRETDNIIVIAATNAEDSLDSALKRAGRFDREIRVNLPTLTGRKDILDLYLSKVFFDETVDTTKLARITTGMSGADLANLVNIAMLICIKAGRTACSQLDLEQALERVSLGVERRSLLLSLAEKRSIATRQAGSFLCALLTDCRFKPRSMTVLPRGQQLGSFMLESTSELLNMHKRDVVGQLDITLGARVAIELLEGDKRVSNHCEATVEKVTSRLYSLVKSGMFREFTGLSNTSGLKTGPEYVATLDATVKTLMAQAHERAKRKLSKHKSLLEELIEELIAKETMTLAEVSKVVRYYCGRNGISTTEFHHLEG